MNTRQKIEMAALAASVMIAGSGAALLGAFAQTRRELREHAPRPRGRSSDRFPARLARRRDLPDGRGRHAPAACDGERPL